MAARRRSWPGCFCDRPDEPVCGPCVMRRRSGELRVRNVASRAQLPRRLRPGAIYVVGPEPSWAVMACPCGTGHRIDLNIAHFGRTRWRIDSQARNVWPSVHVRRRSGLDCHFVVRDGSVRWCEPHPARPSRLRGWATRTWALVCAREPDVPYGGAHDDGREGLEAQTSRRVTSAEEDHHGQAKRFGPDTAEQK